MTEPNMSKHRLPDGRENLKAHDVRHLCVCAHCGNLADDRETVSPNHHFPHVPETWHPKCLFEEYGGDYVVERLSRDQQNKFALGDIPVEVMKKLLRQR